jgi:Family of unknown function (DUF5677)
MTDVVRPPCAELLRVVQAIDQMIAQYRVALRSVAAVGEWEAPQEGFTMGWLLIRNVEAVILMARHDEILVTAAWSNARTAFEISARIIWMLQPDDRYEAECRWLALLDEWESIERKLVREVPERAEFHTARAQAVRDFREGVIRALPSDYRPPQMPNFRDILIALDNPQMYRFYREGSQYIHGSMYAGTSYSKNLGTMRKLGDFTSTVDWVLPLRLCWLSLREATRFILQRLEVPQGAMPNWNEINERTDATFQELASYAAELRQHNR